MPLAVTPAVAAPIDAFSLSEKPSLDAVLAIVSACVATLPTRTLPKLDRVRRGRARRWRG